MDWIDYVGVFGLSVLNGGFAFMTHAHILTRKSLLSLLPTFLLWVIILAFSLTEAYARAADPKLIDFGCYWGGAICALLIILLVIIESFLERRRVHKA